MITQNKRECNKYIFNGLYLTKYNEYSVFLEDCNITKDTIEWRLKHIRGFLCYLEKQQIELREIKPENVYDYLNRISNLAIRTKEHRAVCIRLFLNWLHTQNILNFDGNSVLPSIKCNKNSTLISNYTTKEVTKIINSVNLNEENGKRDLAILLLFAHLGLRLNDVKHLKLENIHWSENRIILIQSKNHNIGSFWMSEDLRYSLIDYLKNERPKINSDYFFVNENSQLYSSSNYYNIVNKYFKKAKINITNKKSGPHSLRHSLATITLNNGHSIYEISDLLGHSNTDTTKIYSKVDTKTLKKLSLEVPVWKI